MTDLRRIVAETTDSAGDHATAVALLLELQAQLGALGALASSATDRGRRPFRPPENWGARLGELAYGVYQLADQTGVDLEVAVRAAAQDAAQRARTQDPERGWPFESR